MTTSPRFVACAYHFDREKYHNVIMRQYAGPCIASLGGASLDAVSHLQEDTSRRRVWCTPREHQVSTLCKKPWHRNCSQLRSRDRPVAISPHREAHGRSATSRETLRA